MVGIENLLKLSRNVSLARMSQQSQISSMEIRELSDKQLVYSHWMAIILVSGPHAKITFKCHFRTASAQQLAAKAYHLKPEEISTRRALDFMREFCNLAAGGIKAALLAHQIKLAISLPIITRGFDEIFFLDLLLKDSVCDHWLLASDHTDIICSVTVDTLQEIDFTNLQTDIGQNSESEIEMF